MTAWEDNREDDDEREKTADALDSHCCWGQEQRRARLRKKGVALGQRPVVAYDSLWALSIHKHYAKLSLIWCWLFCMPTYPLSTIRLRTSKTKIRGVSNHWRHAGEGSWSKEMKTRTMSRGARRFQDETWVSCASRSVWFQKRIMCRSRDSNRGSWDFL